uniref:NADH-ubiquinone oxidoreductase chain 5 n=1 Tax=Cymus sp. TaxID=2931286 RepID=A0A8T9ZXB9_9HEMI|nr:NADH dehydrogenase subunit 5 [Cymus sp.]
MNYIIFYYFWFFILFILGLIFYLVSVYFIYLNYFIIMDWEIVNLNSSSLVMTIFLDWMSLLFISGVLFISSMVVLYSLSYMSGELYMHRFLFLVLLFILSMCLMVLSPNLVSILLGWDGLGLVSYCLVIYFNNFSSYNAGMLTILTNRIGDVFILLGVSYLVSSGSFYFMYYLNYFYDWSLILFFMIALASFTKSAQIPFSSWLPAAMAAPTPVSSLVHSSTLVTAGVYLLIRFSNLIALDTSFFLIISVLTMFMSGLGANYEYDLKKIIALSTLSQLGLMMSILFMGFPILSFYHLLTHAFFKALLFMCAGLYIHNVNNVQDIRFMGGLNYSLPFTSSCFLISNFSLCGLPFMSGFYSKDMIVELMLMSYTNLFVYLLFYVSIGLTVCYSMRLLYYIMFNNMNMISFGSYIEENNMNLSMIFLGLMGIFSGSSLSWLLFPYPNLVLLPYMIKFMILFFIVLGLLLGYNISKFYYKTLIYNNLFYSFISYMWFMPNFSTYFVYSKMNYINYYLDLMDSGWGEYLISKLMMFYFIYLSKFNSYIHNNNIKIFFIIFLLLGLLMLI